MKKSPPSTERLKILATVVLTLVLTLCADAEAARILRNAPEIFGIDPGEAPAGSTIKVTGAGFERTRYVLFAAGRTGQQAKFKVTSDKELEVIAPPYLKDGMSATVVVVTWSGAAVGVPASVLEVDLRKKGGAKTATFYHVRAGGELGASQGVVLVDEGGVATASDKEAICFVKNGGTLRNTDHFSGLVIYERDAILQTSPQPHNPLTRLLQVPVITASPGVEPFIYQRPENPATRAESPPRVSAVGPGRVPQDGIVTLKGSGFSETSEVRFVGDGVGRETSAGFRIVSDEELQVQVPERLSGAARLLIRNPRGSTLVIARDEANAPRARPPSKSGGGNASSQGRANRARASASPVVRQTNNAIVNDVGGRNAADRDGEPVSLSIVPSMFTIVPP
jgi:hypothetical protein